MLPYWRVWFLNLQGGERYFDVPGFWGPDAIREAHERFRAEGPEAMRGWWMDRWQPLNVRVGRWDKRQHKTVIDGPPLRRRLRRKRRKGR